VRVYARSSTYKLGANQRDDAVDVSRLVLQGRNTVGAPGHGWGLGAGRVRVAVLVSPAPGLAPGRCGRPLPSPSLPAPASAPQITFSCSDGRPFALALMLMRQRSVQQVKVSRLPSCPPICLALATLFTPGRGPPPPLPSCTPPMQSSLPCHPTTPAPQALMQPKEALPAALDRVRRSVRGGLDADDDDIEMGNVVVSLKDPYTYA
jgi:hypothetical protein